MPYPDAVSWWANASTIFGVVFAVILYSFWRRDYKAQQAHLYALDLLKKLKALHFEIELLRKPKFHNPKTLVEDIKNKFIPQIEEKILSKLVDVQVDLLVAEMYLVKHKDLQAKFNLLIRKEIMHKINAEVYIFYSSCESSAFKAQNTGLFKIIFPTEVNRSELDIKMSKLGTELEIINDEFNQAIEDNFNKIYSDLKDNLVDSIFIKLKHFIKKILFCG